eukprot:CAMPEP_0185915696 /NCGR_PEP_ID=MMETSP0924C-20121207/2677_1 /TAXON_ID=321610 /ORGANISM="Perkinsus chesapeaki, Strain ATCC PRA-65" /LENGTH=75 /DNA_ID=CAMNT_0028639973 /DNA_START=60 /DNA_END=283 /DNA_ORIENTATION=+
MIKRAWKELNTEYVDSMRKLQEAPTETQAASCDLNAAITATRPAQKPVIASNKRFGSTHLIVAPIIRRAFCFSSG